MLPIFHNLSSCVFEIYFSYFSSNTYAVGTEKNCHIEMVLLSIQTTIKIDGEEIITKFKNSKFQLAQTHVPGEIRKIAEKVLLTLIVLNDCNENS